jgi:hypothetical protein
MVAYVHPCRTCVGGVVLRTGAKLPFLLALVLATTLDIVLSAPALVQSPVQGHACAL